MPCEICGHPESVSHYATEMMFGLGDKSEYLECVNCGRLKLLNIPSDWSRYYPKDYYSFGSTRISPAKTALLYAHRLGISAPIFTLKLSKLLQLRGCERILDVGGGSGQIVKELRMAGYKAVSIDPYLDVESSYAKRGSLDEVDGRWDRIMFHHSIEHMGDHLHVLRTVRDRLTDDGLCLVRMPVAEKTWRLYGVHWVQLDAPRHLLIHTLKSFYSLAAKADFSVVRAVGDSGAFQFWGSELYKAGVPLTVGMKELSKYFSKGQMREFQSRADELNKNCVGDAAAFLLKRCRSSAS